MRFAGFTAFVLSCTLIFSCTLPRSYYLRAPGVDKQEMQALFSLLDGPDLSEEERFAVIQKIGNTMLDREDYGWLESLLSDEIARNPDGPYNAMHMLTMAWAYSRQGAEKIAALYYDRIIKNYTDLTVDGESIHYACLRRLIALVPEPERRIEFR
ncbi:MAG: hypothetical protein E4H20_12535, partial [Spirochaetales bacterium]